VSSIPDNELRALIVQELQTNKTLPPAARQLLLNGLPKEPMLEPLRATEDHNAGRCQAQTKYGTTRCINTARWSVLTTSEELEVCGTHVRALRTGRETLAIQPLEPNA
jgi:hypothetical protein